MAGRVGGDTKIEIAKREAVAFLGELPDEIEVALVVYGHRGTNQESGKAESCASSEMIHAFEDNRRALVNSIQGLSPTGYTPLGGVLEYSAAIIAKLAPPRDGELGAIADAESQRARYEYCVLINEAKIVSPFNNATRELVSCYGQNDPNDSQFAIRRALQKLPSIEPEHHEMLHPI